MTPAARYQAAIDVLDRIAQGQATEPALLGWARGARYAGSKDRAAVRDIVFGIIRRKRSCAAFGGGSSGRALVLGLETPVAVPLNLSVAEQARLEAEALEGAD